jgi:hypothetical protein
MLWSSDMKVNVVLQSSSGRPKTSQNGQILIIENYNIQEHEDWYRVEDNDSLRMIQKRPSKIIINERLHYMIILNINPFRSGRT